MLTIRAEQMQAFENARLATFSRELAQRARLRHGGAVDAYTMEKLEALMAHEVVIARRAGIRDRRLLERYADLAVTLGFGFGERLDWVAAKLASNRRPGDKLSDIEDTAVFVIRGG